ncbi:hypothetical protein [Streptomyces sp. NPDC002855]|uniref:hypothetical protein n=1 Tax=Streptomyces sp. NPDC002855 TaxID=3154437 RepID=UPI00331F5D22
MAESTEQSSTGALTETATDLAYRALLDHATKCRRCAVNWQECPTRRALSTTLREAR